MKKEEIKKNDGFIFKIINKYIISFWYKCFMSERKLLFISSASSKSHSKTLFYEINCSDFNNFKYFRKIMLEKYESSILIKDIYD